MTSKKILVIAPHPDDEVLGCGGTLRKYSDLGAEIALCLVTESREPEYSKSYVLQKQEEIKKSSAILGVSAVVDLQFPTAKLDTIPQKDIIDKLAAVIATHTPDTLYIPHCGDAHKDHRLVHEAALVASRLFPGQSIRRVYAYETLSETEWGLIPFWPNFYEDISLTLDRKKEALGAYQTELREFPHPRSVTALEALAKKRGSEVGLEAAEAFMLVRSVS